MAVQKIGVIGAGQMGTGIAHVLALAWSVDADVWTTDRDFAGTGIATWSTANLMRGLAGAAKRERLTCPREGSTCRIRLDIEDGI